MRRPSGLILLTAMMSVPLGAAGPACAQDADEPEEVAARARIRQRVRITDRQFDLYVFGNEGGAESGRRIIEARLKSRVAFIDQVCGISRDQRKKLELAGRGDIKRFFDRIEELREQVRRAEDDLGQVRRHLLKAAEQAGRPHRELFADESLFGKTLRTTLDPWQSARYQKHWDEDRLLRHQSRVEWVSRTLQKNLGLDDVRRLRLFAVLLEETRPARRSGPSDYFGIMFQVSQIPEAKLRPIFDETEWRLLRLEFDAARRQEPMLRESGLLPEDRPAWDTVRRGGAGTASGAIGKTEAPARRPSTREESRIMIRSNQHPLTGGARMTKQILASVVTLGVAVATVTSALALDGLDESAAQEPAAPRHHRRRSRP